MALEAHYYGDFEVCRKFHLTEGICAVASKILELKDYKDIAQKFLDGQMDMLILLGTILKEAEKLEKTGQLATEDTLVQQLRETLRIGNLIENHIYYAGHLIELAGFAISLNYRIKLEHLKSIIFIINHLNDTLPKYIPYLSIQDCFLTLGHYRRGITLFLELLELKEAKYLNRSHLQRFTVDFDSLAWKNPIKEETDFLVKEKKVYSIASLPKKPRQEFITIVNAYASMASGELQPRGKFDHFRRIGPPAWPRAFHYELLDYGDKIGLEIHLESESILPMKEHVISFKEKIAEKFSDRLVEWDPHWYHGYGRLRVLFTCYSTAEEVATSMCIFIDETFPTLNKHACKLDVNPLNLVEHTVVLNR